MNPGTQEYQPILLLAQSYNPSSIVSKLLFPFTTTKHTNKASPHPKKTTRKSSGFICSFPPTIQSILSNMVFINLLNLFFLPLCLSVVMVFFGNTQEYACLFSALSVSSPTLSYWLIIYKTVIFQKLNYVRHTQRSITCSCIFSTSLPPPLIGNFQQYLIACPFYVSFSKHRPPSFSHVMSRWGKSVEKK